MGIGGVKAVYDNSKTFNSKRDAIRQLKKQIPNLIKSTDSHYYEAQVVYTPR